MAYEVTVSGWFSAAHQLRLADGTVEPLHGHNWNVRVTYRAPGIDTQGYVVDFTQLKPTLDDILSGLHDTFLNDLEAFSDRNPTAEIVAEAIAAVLQDRFETSAWLTTVEVEEEPGCFGRYLP